MTTLEDLVDRIAPDAGSLWDPFQHQGSPTRLGIETMDQLVELDSDPELWRIIAVIAAGAADPLSRATPEVAARFAQALRRAEQRIVELLAAVPDEEHALALVGARAAATGRFAIYDICEQLKNDEVEQHCPRCAALLYVERGGLVRWGERKFPPGDTSPLPDIVLALPPALGRVFGSIRCPRCGYDHTLIDEAPPATTIVRRHPSGTEHVIEWPAALHELFVGRLVAMSRQRVDDCVRLAGIGRFATKYYPPYEGRNPRTGEAVHVVGKVTISFAPEWPILALATEHAVPSILPSDDARLDETAAAIFDAFTRHDVVAIRGIGRLELATVPGRAGFTVDGDPITVPARIVLRFKAAPELDACLSPG